MQPLDFSNCLPNFTAGLSLNRARGRLTIERASAKLKGQPGALLCFHYNCFFLPLPGNISNDTLNRPVLLGSLPLLPMPLNIHYTLCEII